jgi:hypothetical protein
MKLSYSIGKAKVSKEVDKASFMLTNRIGGYTYLSDEPRSRYQGFFFFDNYKMFKIIEDISLVDKNPVKAVKNKLYLVEKTHSNTLVESFFMPLKSNSLVYELNDENEIQVVLDIKESYDNREFGRVYDVWVEKDTIIVKFTKRTNQGEDGNEGQEEYTLFLAIKPDKLNYEITDGWSKRVYSDDKERNSFPFERYVYYALKLRGKSFVFSVSNNKDLAVEEASKVFSNKSKLKKDFEKSIGQLIKNSKIKNNELKLAYVCALNALDSLRVRTKRTEGLFAGLPWFFQLWARDELISLKGLYDIDKSMVKNILMRWFFDLKHGKLNSKFPEEGLASVDGLGWLYLRVNEAIKKKVFNKVEIDKIKKVLEKNFPHLMKKTEESLAVCGDKETWMDSLERKSPVELQAFRLSKYRFLFNLTKNKGYKQLEHNLVEKVKAKFWNGKFLVDDLEKQLIRPNLFIAAYVYPDLLSKKEWITCFENVLPKLFFDWGGLSTIDKTDPSFVPKHTGEDPKSYHNGDSWFWLNNLSALVLNRINGKKFNKYIKKIIEAGAKEILYSGISGCGAELSSASKLKSEGCLNQAWSNAMFIELVKELN